MEYCTPVKSSLRKILAICSASQGVMIMELQGESSGRPTAAMNQLFATEVPRGVV